MAVMLILVIQAIKGLDLPLTYDEMNIGGAVANRTLLEVIQLFWAGVYRFTNTQHLLSTLSMFFSVKLFGANEVALRLSAIPFSMGFLITLFKFTKKYCSNLGTAIIYLNLIANANVSYYLISGRSYACMMFLSLLLLSFVLDTLTDKTLPSNGRVLLFAATFLLNILTNTAAGLFGLLLFASLTIYFLLNRNEMSLLRQSAILKCLLVMAGIVPLFVLGALKEVKVQSGLSQLVGVNPELNLGTMGYLLGLDRLLQSKGFILLCISMWLYRVVKWDIRKDFMNLLLSFSWLMIFSILVGLRVYSYAPRFALAFLIPYLFWIGQSLTLLPINRFRKVYIALALIFCGVLPLARRRDFAESIYGQYAETHFFLVGARAALMNPDTCVQYFGDSFEVQTAKELYLNGRKSCPESKNPSKDEVIYPGANLRVVRVEKM
jgi:hypothetical protein